MANKLDFLSILAGLDVEKSQSNIESQIAQISKKLSSQKLHLEIDTTKINKALASLDIQLPKTELFDDIELKAKTKLLQDLRQEYAGYDYEVKKFSSTAIGDQYNLVAQVKKADGELKKIVASTFINRGEPTKTQFDVIQPETLFNSTEATTRLVRELKNYGKEIDDLLQKEAKRGLDIDEQARLTNLLSTSSEKANGHLNLLSDAYNAGSISAERFSDLVQETALSIAALDQKITDTTDKIQMDKVYAESSDALKQYKNGLLEMESIQKQMKTGALDTSDGQKQVESLQKELAKLYKIASQDDGVLQQLSLIDDQFSKKQAKTGRIDALMQEKAELKEIKALYKEYNLYERKKEESKRSPHVAGQDDPVVIKYRELAEKRLQEAESRSEKLRSKDNVLDKTLADLETIEKQAKATRDAVSSINKVRDEQLEHSLTQKYFSAEPAERHPDFKKRTDLPKTFKPEQLLGEKSQIESFVQAYGGVDAQLKKNVFTTKEFGQTLQHVTLTLDNQKKLVRDVTYTYNTANETWYQTGEKIRANTNYTHGFGESLINTAKNMMGWVIIGRLVYGAVGKIGEGFRWLTDMNKELVQSAIIQNTSLSATTHLMQQYIDTGKEMSIPAKEIARVTTELLRQGLTIEESNERMQSILKLSATGMVTVEQSMKTITTAVNALGVAHEHASNVILKASAISAADVDGLGEALSKTASSAGAVGMSIEQTTSLMTALMQTTLEGSSIIGNSLKTIIARFNSIREEGGGYNEDLNKLHTALESIGVQYTTTDGQIRQTYDVLKDTAAVWETLTRNQQAYIATVGAGVHNQSRFLALMQNFDLVESFMQDLENVDGVLDDAFDIQLQGFEAQLNRITVLWEEIWNDSFKPELITDTLGMAENLLSVLQKLLDTFGSLTIATAAFSTAFLMKSSTSLKTMSTQLADVETYKGVFETVGKGTPVLGAFIQVMQQVGNRTLQTSKAMEAFKQGINTAILGTLKAALPLLATFMTQVIIAFAVNKILEWVAAVATGSKELERLTAQLDDAKVKLDAIRSAGHNVSAVFEEWVKLSSKNVLSASETERYTEVMNNIAEMAPDTVAYYDEMGNAIIRTDTNLKELNNSLAKQRELANFQYRQSFSKEYEKLAKDLKDQTKEVQTITDVIEQLRNSGTISAKQLQDLGISESSTSGVLQRTSPNLFAYNNEASDIAKQAFEQKIQSAFKIVTEQERQAAQKMLRQLQPVIASIGKDADLSADSIKAFSIALQGLDMSKYGTQGLFEAEATKIAASIKTNEDAFNAVFKKYAELREEVSKTGDAVAFNEQVKVLREELSELITTLSLDVDPSGILSALDAIIEKEEGISTLIERLEKMRGLAEQNQDYFGKLNQAREEYNEHGRMSISTLMDVVEASEGALDIEELLLLSQDERMEAMDNAISKMYEMTMAEKQREMAALSSAKTEKQREFDRLNALTRRSTAEQQTWETLKTELKEVEKNIALVQAETALMQESFLIDLDPMTQAGDRLEDIATRLTDYNKYLADFKENKAFSDSSLNEIINKYPELIYLLKDEIALKEELIKMTGTEEEMYRKAMARKLEASQAFYRDNIKIYNNLIKDLADRYNIDVSNFRNAEEAKYAIASAVNASIGRLPGGGSVGQTADQVQGQIDSLKAGMMMMTGEAKLERMAKIQELTQYQKMLSGIEEVSNKAVEGLTLPSFIPKASGGSSSKKSATQQFREVLHIMPRYAAQLNDLANSYDKVAKAQEQAYKRINTDSFFRDKHSVEYFTAQVALMHELYSLQGKAKSQQDAIVKIQNQGANEFKKLTGLQVDANNAEAAFLNWKQIKESAIHKIQQDQKFVSSDVQKNTMSEQVKLIQHQISLAEYHKQAWQDATSQLEDLNNKWWDLFSNIQKTMESLTQLTIDKINLFRESIVEALEASRGEFDRYNRRDDLHSLDMLALDLKKLRKEFTSASGTFDTGQLSRDLDRVEDDTYALFRTVEALNRERERILSNDNLTEIEKQEQLQKVIEKQIELEKDLDAERQDAIARLQEMTLRQTELENAMEYRIELKQEELKALQKQKQIEEKIRQEQQKQLEILRAMDDTRFSYITALGEEILTYDRSKLKDLESNLSTDDGRETQLNEEIERMQKELADFREANRIQQETLRILNGINDNLFTQVSTDIDRALEGFEKIMENMIKTLTDSISEFSDKWFDAQSKKETETARQIISIYASMDSLMKQLFGQSLPALKSFSTGGYTGDWGNKDGKLAVLHQKEIVLNESDTEKLLQAITFLKDFDMFNLEDKLFNKNNYSTENNNQQNIQHIQIHKMVVETENANNFAQDFRNVVRKTITSLG